MFWHATIGRSHCSNILARALDNDPLFHDHSLFSKSAELRIETRTLLRKELSKNLNLNSFDWILRVDQSPLLRCLSHPPPWTQELELVDRQLVKCGRSAVSFQTSRFHMSKAPLAQAARSLLIAIGDLVYFRSIVTKTNWVGEIST